MEIDNKVQEHNTFMLCEIEKNKSELSSFKSGFEIEQNKWKNSFREQIADQIRTELGDNAAVIKTKLDEQKTALVEIRNQLSREISEIRDKTSTPILKPSSDQTNTETNNKVETQVKESVSNAEAYLIEFHGEYERIIHPMYFLKVAKQYCEVSVNTWEYDKLVLLRFLKHSANMWAREVILTLDSYNDFEQAFKENIGIAVYKDSLKMNC